MQTFLAVLYSLTIICQLILMVMLVTFGVQHYKQGVSLRKAKTDVESLRTMLDAIKKLTTKKDTSHIEITPK